MLREILYIWMPTMANKYSLLSHEINGFTGNHSNMCNQITTLVQLSSRRKDIRVGPYSQQC